MVYKNLARISSDVFYSTSPGKEPSRSNVTIDLTNKKKLDVRKLEAFGISYKRIK